jgi:hypothetical protein
MDTHMGTITGMDTTMGMDIAMGMDTITGMGMDITLTWRVSGTHSYFFLRKSRKIF